MITGKRRIRNRAQGKLNKNQKRQLRSMDFCLNLKFAFSRFTNEAKNSLLEVGERSVVPLEPTQRATR